MATMAAMAAVVALGSVGSAQAAAFECLIEPWQVIEIRSPVEGLIDKITVQRGDTVRKGQMLVELKSDAERSAVDAARYRSTMEGRITSSRNRVEFATKKLQRSTELHDLNYLAAQTRDEAEAELKLAEAELQDAIENRELAKIDWHHANDLLELRLLQSPVNGLVVDRMLNVGDIAEAGTGRKAIVKVAQIDPLRVEVVLPVEVFGKLSVGMVAEVSTDGFAGHHAATIKVVDRVFDAASATFGVRLELPNPGGRLPAGLRCQVEFPKIEMKNVLGKGQRKG
jgi:RND family efflux transporter MFP subunit